jgi:ATP-binding cassette subfamily C protein
MFDVIKVSLGLLTRRQKVGFLLIVMFRGLLSMLDIAAVALIGLLASYAASGFLGEDSQSLFGIKIEPLTDTQVVFFLILIGTFFLVKAVASTLLLRWMYYFLARVEASAAEEIAQYLFGSGGMAQMRLYSRSEIQWAVTTSTSVTFSGVLGVASILVTEGVLISAMFALFTAVDPLGTVVIVLYFTAVIVGYQLIVNSRLKSSSSRLTSGNIGVTQSILDLIDGFKEISVLKKGDFFLERFSVARRNMAMGDAAIRVISTIPRYFIEAALILGVIAFVTWQFLRGELADGLISAGVFLVGGVRIMGALLPLQGAFTALRTLPEQAELGQQILRKARDSEAETTPLVEDLQEERTPDHTGLAVMVEEVTFTHGGNSSPTVEKISLAIPGGHYVALVGPSGAGKTTIADLILGLHEPDSGKVLVGGTQSSWLRNVRPGLMAYVPQRPGLVSGSFAENIALGVPPEEIDFDCLTDAVEKAYLSEFVAQLPEGIHTFLGKHSDSLSGGQIQRLGLARALYTKPKLIVLDEATSALDAGIEASISSTIQALAPSTTIVVIAHRLSTIQHADEVFVIDKGAVVASGPFKKLRKTVPMIAEYVSLMTFDEE